MRPIHQKCGHHKSASRTFPKRGVLALQRLKPSPALLAQTASQNPFNANADMFPKCTHLQPQKRAVKVPVRRHTHKPLAIPSRLRHLFSTNPAVVAALPLFSLP